MSKYNKYEAYSAYYGKYGAGEVEDLDDRLVSIAMPSRNRYPLNTQMSGQTYDYEDGVINSDGGGVQGVIKGGLIYIGEGYENSADKSNVGTTYTDHPSATLLLGDPSLSVLTGDIVTRIDVVTITDDYFFGSEPFLGSSIGNISASEIFIDGLLSSKNDFENLKSGKYELTFIYNINSDTIITQQKYAKAGGHPGSLTLNNIFITIGYNLHFVKDTAPDGRLVIDESWTSATHTFINLNEDLVEQETYINIGTINPHLKNDGVTRNVYLKMLLIYDGLLTIQEIQDEIAIIKRNKYKIPSGISKVLEL